MCWIYCGLVSQPTVPLFSAATSRVSLSCHYRQTSHGSGVALRRQEKGWGVLSDLLVLRRLKGLFGWGRHTGRNGKIWEEDNFYSSFWWLKVFGGLLKGNSCQLSSRTSFLSCWNVCVLCCIQIAHVDWQINSWGSIVFSWDYVYGISFSFSDVTFLFFFLLFHLLENTSNSYH